jgi:prolyl-tRNA synthetase
LRLSTLFGRTLRETPSEAKTAGHALLLRAGMIRPLPVGALSCLPLGWRGIQKITDLIRQEMETIGGQELFMPCPLDQPYEAILDLARREINSYRQLPLLIYQVGFPTYEGYSFHADPTDLEATSSLVHQAALNVFHRCELEPLIAEVTMGVEFVLPHERGEETLVRCHGCGYIASLESATAAKGAVGAGEELGEIEAVATPGVDTIAGLAETLGLPTSRTAKAVFYTADGQLLFVVIRGDLEVDEAKLVRLLGTTALRAASEEEIRAAGAVPGYASPVGLRGVRVVVDDSIPLSRNLVAGANREGTHLRNVNYPRDFQAELVADIALVREGEACARCGAALKLQRAIELGRIREVGPGYSQAAGATFLDRDGRARPLALGHHTIELDSLMAAVAEAHHDEQGIVWPPALASYQVHLVTIGVKNAEVVKTAEGLYTDLQAHGFEVLYDDRNESAGVKFNDADLIGLPLRLTISRRTLAQDGIEVKRRWEAESRVIALDRLPEQLKELLP